MDQFSVTLAVSNLFDVVQVGKDEYSAALAVSNLFDVVQVGFVAPPPPEIPPEIPPENPEPRDAEG